MTTDFRALCAELTDVLDGLFEDPEIPGEIRRSHSLEEYLTRARAALADEPAVSSALADTHYEWELEDAAGQWQAGGSSNSQSDVEREGMRYLHTYAQDGPHKLIICQHTTQTINEITNDH